MTTRRWMIAVACVAILAGLCIQVDRWWQLKQRQSRARGNYASAAKQYEEGYLPFWDLLDLSQDLLQVKLDLSHRREHQILAVASHLHRVHRIIEEERKYALVLESTYRRDADMIEDSLERSKATWGQWLGAHEIEAALEQCNLGLHKLKEERSLQIGRLREPN
jgi:hypothetical protein